MATDAASRHDVRIEPALLKLGLAVVLGIFMSLLDTTIVNVTVGTLATDLHARIAVVGWVTTAYLLGLALVLPLTGWASDRFGTRRLFLGSLAVFTLSSLACGLADDIGWLVAFRIVQGAGGGLITPVAQTVIARAAGPGRIARMMSLIGIPAMLAPIFGPALGGLIIDNLSWRWVFFVNVPIGAAAIICCSRVLPADGPRPNGQLDRLGLALLCPGLAALVYGLSNAGTTRSLTAVSVSGWILAGTVLVVAFVLRALRLGDRALIPVRYLRDRAFAAGSVCTFANQAALFGVMILVPLYYQQVRGHSALSAGLLLVPQGVGSALAMVMAGMLADRLGPRRVVVAGMAIMLAATMILTRLGPHTDPRLLLTALFVRGIGLGSSMMPAMAASYHNLARDAVGRATTMLSIMQRTGGSVGTAIVTVILAARSAISPDGNLMAGAYSYDGAFWAVMVITGVGLAASLRLPDHPPGMPGSARPSLTDRKFQVRTRRS